MKDNKLKLPEYVCKRLSDFDLNEVKKDFNAFTRNDSWETKVAPLWFQTIVKELKDLEPNAPTTTLTVMMFKGIILHLTSPAELKAA